MKSVCSRLGAVPQIVEDVAFALSRGQTDDTTTNVGNRFNRCPCLLRVWQERHFVNDG